MNHKTPRAQALAPRDRRKTAFTLAEVLITLAIIGVVAALTIPTVVRNYQERQMVTQAKKFYRNFASFIQQWQVEEGCTSNVRECLMTYEGEYLCNIVFRGMEEKFKIIKTLELGVGTTNVDWLPEVTTNLDGTAQVWGWQGVSGIDPQGVMCRYMLADGATMSLHFPDTYRQSGFVFFDVNGKKPPNRVGKDTFVIGVGAYNNPKFPSVHPFYNEDSSDGGQGLCNIRDNDCPSSVDTCTITSCSPMAYILKHDKLPPITW